MDHAPKYQAPSPDEAAHRDVEREEEYPGDFEDGEELEDEVVECEKLIAQATTLLAAVREHYLPSELSAATTPSAPVNTSPQKK